MAGIVVDFPRLAEADPMTAVSDSRTARRPDLLRSVVLLRHTRAGRKSTWEHDDDLRPLDPTGLEQALRLVDTLRCEHFDRIVTSPLVRCHHSVAALAADRRVPVDTASWLRPDAEPPDIERGLGFLCGQVLLCTHGECVKPILDVLVGDAHERRKLSKGEAVSLTWDDDGTLATIRWIDPGR